MTKALIIGGGIAGPVTAMALQKAGIEATVFEAHGAPADHTGLFLNTASNGLDALKAIDLDLAARADGHPMPMPVVLKLFVCEKAHEWAYRYHIDWDEKVA